jgi:dephospho-CoA kinase
MIIGITGTIGAGKGTVVEYLKQRGFSHYSSSGILREILAERGLPATRLNMSTLADELMQQYEGGVLQVSHERAQEAGDKNYILEAIHRESEAAYIRSIGGVILGVDADIRTRFERSVRRGDGEKDDVTFEEFLENSKREDDGRGETGANIRAVLKNADVIITNNGTTEELTEQVDRALASLG